MAKYPELLVSCSFWIPIATNTKRGFPLPRKRIATFLLVLLLIVAALAWVHFAESKNTVESVKDQSRLQEMISSQNYNALLGNVKANPIARRGFSFVVMGDSRTNASIAQEILRNAALEKPIFILHTGDLVEHGTVDEYLSYHFPLVNQIAPIPVIPVPGNHESGPQKDFTVFTTIYGSGRFSFDYGDCRIVGINNNGSEGLNGDRLDFIDRELSKPGAKTKFVVMHVPPAFVESGMNKCPEGTKYRGPTHGGEALQGLLKLHHVQGVFLGHDHGFAAATIDGVQYVITGGAGADLYEGMCWMEPFHHYVVVHVTPEGSWQEVVRRDQDQWVRSKLTEQN